MVVVEPEAHYEAKFRSTFHTLKFGLHFVFYGRRVGPGAIGFSRVTGIVEGPD